MDKNYCLIEDVAQLLRPRWKNKNDFIVYTKKILHHKAIDHLSGPMELYCSLPKRACEYLKKNSNRWVSKKEITDLAINAGFRDSEIYILFSEYIPEIKNIGSTFVAKDTTEERNIGPSGEYYRWYNMTEDELKKQQEQLDAFDAM